MKARSLLAVSAIIYSGSILGAYDKPFSIEFHTGPSFSSETIRDVKLHTGYSLGASISYHILDGLLGVYSGFDLHGFETDSQRDSDVSTSLLYGYGIGVSHQGEFPIDNLGYFVRIGLHYSQFSLLDNDDDEINDTDFEFGLQTSAGIDYKLPHGWALRGEIQYKTFSDYLQYTTTNEKTELDLTTVNLGASYSF